MLYLLHHILRSFPPDGNDYIISWWVKVIKDRKRKESLKRVDDDLDDYLSDE